ncbi:MAG: hypothetical protein A2451_00615 [Bdellovibrionales bacterium RIFOXYC2_FULL_39_8]|nr:MAG: hypothetical protein A2385_01865 [Bdellovibrionales bacterium RIFOXYB1_FULL_39_21]OFZ43658.1 MAG: hypothetical protein A2485_15905 [Bdellovibrionales bacterium RIFOXYC12_FULL_39_17]OFZ47583.1 MAG: hypothetical protein A2404_14035 [Bdellovibrionales bacterium RIFOXYC1_FULL_39_130]OFZ71998.1 MAG: hypothetical protein A2451_00615 [Bdellovibrionales bacterium RIFOXYC2_FULL_39_8]OFZ76109.1 MAG: hypothetical protein A2560_16625 [Bdellovibrionales bacterium RIFOXYD1_FULL_39_84]
MKFANILKTMLLFMMTAAISIPASSYDVERLDFSRIELSQILFANLDELIVARQQAMLVGSFRFFYNDFMSADKELKKIIFEIENNKFDDVIKMQNLLQLKYFGLELRSLKYIFLKHASAVIEQAKQEGAIQSAPKALAITEKIFRDTETFIIASFDDVENINMRVDETENSANKLLKIVKDSKAKAILNNRPLPMP